MKETSYDELDAGTGGDSGEPGEDSDIEDISWDALLIKEEDDKAMYCSE